MAELLVEAADRAVELGAVGAGRHERRGRARAPPACARATSRSPGRASPTTNVRVMSAKQALSRSCGKRSQTSAVVVGDRGRSRCAWPSAACAPVARRSGRRRGSPARRTTVDRRLAQALAGERLAVDAPGRRRRAPTGRAATRSRPCRPRRHADARRMPSSSGGVFRRRRSSNSRWSATSSTPAARSASARRSGNAPGTRALRIPSDWTIRTSQRRRDRRRSRRPRG